MYYTLPAIHSNNSDSRMNSGFKKIIEYGIETSKRVSHKRKGATNFSDDIIDSIFLF